MGGRYAAIARGVEAMRAAIASYISTACAPAIHTPISRLLKELSVTSGRRTVSCLQLILPIHFHRTVEATSSC